jgi:hypothetical protein
VADQRDELALRDRQVDVGERMTARALESPINTTVASARFA